MEQQVIRQALARLAEGKDLDREMALATMDDIMSGSAGETLTAAFLTALHMKGETPAELAALAQGMRDHSLPVHFDGDLLEIVGTGGDQAFTFNISTVASFVVAAAGIPTAKHGNRSVSSKCGAADVLEALGVKLQLTPEQTEAVLHEVGQCFMFAQVHHPAMKYVAPVRKALGIPTAFNLLGPLTNPARANLQLMGVYKEELLQPMAEVLMALGVKRAMVVRGDDGLDEITLTTTTDVREINGNQITAYRLDPADYGFAYCQKDDLVGGDPAVNRDIALDILQGGKGPKRDVVVLNAAACIHIATEKPMDEAVREAAAILDSGKAYEQMKRFVAATQRAGQTDAQ